MRALKIIVVAALLGAFTDAAPSNSTEVTLGASVQLTQVDPLEAIKELTTYIVGEIPVVGGLLSAVLGAFWPSHDEPGLGIEDIWEQLEGRVQHLIDAALRDYDRATRDADLDGLRNLIADVDPAYDLEDNIATLEHLRREVLLDRPHFIRDPDSPYRLHIADMSVGFAYIHLAVLRELALATGEARYLVEMDEEIDAYATYFEATRLDWFSWRAGLVDVLHDAQAPFFDIVLVQDRITNPPTTLAAEVYDWTSEGPDMQWAYDLRRARWQVFYAEINPLFEPARRSELEKFRLLQGESQCLLAGNVPFSPVISGVIPATYWPECQGLCRDEPDCGGWTWRSEGVPDAYERQTCQLLGAVNDSFALQVHPHQVTCDGVYCERCPNGSPRCQKTEFVDVTQATRTRRYPNGLAVESFEECCDFCHYDPDCTVAVFDEATKAYCWPLRHHLETRDQAHPARSIAWQRHTDPHAGPAGQAVYQNWLRNDFYRAHRSSSYPDGVAVTGFKECCSVCDSDSDCAAVVFKEDTSDFCWPIASFEEQIIFGISVGVTVPEASRSVAFKSYRKVKNADFAMTRRTTRYPDGAVVSSFEECYALCQADHECTAVVFNEVTGAGCYPLANYRERVRATNGRSVAYKVNFSP